MSYNPEAHVGVIPGNLTASYVEFTADVTISGTTEATANLIVSATAFQFSGSDPYFIRFWAPQTVCANADFIIYVIYDNGAFLTRMGTNAQTTNNNNYCYIDRRLTPSNAVHTYDIRGFRGATNGTVKAGAGGTGVLPPGYIHVVKSL